MRRRPYDDVANRQLGLVTNRQLHELEWTREQIRHALRVGLLDRIRHNVFRTAGAPRTQDQAWLAAVLAAPGSVLSHLTAGAAWLLLFFPSPSGIDLLRVGSRPRLLGVIGHQTDALPPSHVVVRNRLPMTSAARTLIDGCASLSPKQLRASGNDALRRHLTTLPTLVRAVDEVPVSGRRAIVPIVDFLKTKVPGYDLGDSDPEVDIVEALVTAGFERPAQQIRVETTIGPCFVDVGWPDIRLGYEYDSLEFHVERFHDDRDRLRALKRAGWDIWPITKTTSTNEIVAIATEAFRHERVA